MRPTGYLLSAILLAGVIAIGVAVVRQVSEPSEDPARRDRSASVVPVEAFAVSRGPIADVRRFTGTVKALRDFVVAAKIGGRVEAVAVDLSDEVARGQVVVKLDNDEYVQALAQAEADLAVAKANASEADSLLAIARRELGRFETLSSRGVSTESERDAAQANQLAKSAQLEVARAQVTRATSAVETARIQLGYSTVRATWQGGADARVVAERYVDVGSTIASNEPLVRVIELDQVLAVFFITERDYGLLQPGQEVTLQTDAYRSESFVGSVARVAPVFQESTRQARVELIVDNPGRRLKPGMFVRASVQLQMVKDAVLVPEAALVTRGDEIGVFHLDAEQQSVAWRPLQIGIRQTDQIEVVSGVTNGFVVTLGQQLLKDGSAVSVAESGPGGKKQ